MSTESPNPSSSFSKGWNIILWILQLLVAFTFGFGGYIKLTQPVEILAAQMVWPGDIPEGLLRFIGASEFLGAIGLILPALTRIRPQLTPIAAAGLALIMIFAAVFHAARGEYGVIGYNVSLGILAYLVAWGRFKRLQFLRVSFLPC